MKSVTAGSSHTAALTVDGLVYTWGRNNAGQLGTGKTQSELLPVHIPLPGAVISLVSGYHQTAAVTEQGQLYTWGDGSVGQLGTGDTQNQPRPIHIEL